MTRRHSPLQQFREACEIARAYGMYVVERPAKGCDATDYILYRKTPTKSVRVGRRRDIGAFRRFVEQAARTP